jgi:hypothetical protein
MAKLASMMKSTTTFLSLLALCSGEFSPADEPMSSNVVAKSDLSNDHKGTALDAMKETMGNIWEMMDPVRDTPYFWHVPLAGGELALSYFSVCTGLTEAIRAGAGANHDVS